MEKGQTGQEPWGWPHPGHMITDTPDMEDGPHSFFHLFIYLSIYLFGLSRQGFSVLLAIPELVLETRITPNSEISLSLPPECWEASHPANPTKEPASDWMTQERPHPVLMATSEVTLHQ